MRLTISVLCSAAFIAGCQETLVERRERERREDENRLSELESLRIKAERSGGAPRETISYANAVIELIIGKTRKAVKRGAWLHISLAHQSLDVAIKAAPDDAPTLWVTKGYLYEVTDHATEAMAAYEKSFSIHPRLSNVVMLTSRYDLQGRWRDVPGLCAKARPAIDSTELFRVLDACLYHSHAATMSTGLAWASDEDRSMYAAEVMRLEADAERRRAEREAREIAIFRAKMNADAILQAAAINAAATAAAADKNAAATRAAANKRCLTTLIAGVSHTLCD